MMKILDSVYSTQENYAIKDSSDMCHLMPRLMPQWYLSELGQE